MKRWDDKLNDRIVIDYTDELLSPGEVARRVTNAIAADTEGKIRRALIEMGWTPPAGEMKALPFYPPKSED